MFGLPIHKAGDIRDTIIFTFFTTTNQNSKEKEAGIKFFHGVWIETLTSIKKKKCLNKNQRHFESHLKHSWSKVTLFSAGPFSWRK
jgi:hypothetical protein